MSSEIYWIWLATRPGCGIKLCCQLLEIFGSPEEIWRASRDRLAAALSMKQKHLDAMAEKDLIYAQRIWDDCRRLGIQVLTLEHASYPRSLRTITDPPLVLYVRGTLPDFENQLAISIVGTRKATPYGLQAARYFAGTLAQNGCIIVSGMALGIDGAANRAALEAGEATVAVLGSGVDVCYPSGHKRLMEDIIAHGAVISEYPPGSEPAAKHFPARNRIITALSRGTLVVEAPKKSGALISADLALEQGRDVFAVPGDINRPNSAGCNILIRQGGAELVQTPSDILSYYEQKPIRRRITQNVIPWDIEEKKEPKQMVAAQTPKAFEQQSSSHRKLQGSKLEKLVWNAVNDGSYTVDAIVEQTGLPASDVLTALTMLEIGEYVVRMSDGYRAADDVQL